MMCEKCHKQLAKVRILEAKSDPEEVLSKFLEQHLCGDCAQDYIQSDPHLKQGRWSEPTKHFVLDVSPNPKPVGQSARKPKP